VSEFSVIIDLPEMGIDSSFFAPFFGWINSHKEPLEDEIKGLLQEYARSGHRQLSGRHYQNETGRLSQSTRAEGDFGRDLQKEIELYVDTTQANYAKYVIRGNGRGWQGDPFIDETIEVLKPKITELIHTFFNNAIMQWNRG